MKRMNRDDNGIRRAKTRQFGKQHGERTEYPPTFLLQEQLWFGYLRTDFREIDIRR